MEALRPAVALGDDVRFQIVEVEVENAAAGTFDMSDERLLLFDESYAAEQRKSDLYAGQTVVYVFGVTAAGNSVCVAVTGFRPWIYVELTQVVDQSFINNLCAALTRKWRLPANSISASFQTKKKVYGWVPASLTDVSSVREFHFARIEAPNSAALRAVSQAFEAHNDNILASTPDARLSPLELRRKKELDPNVKKNGGSLGGVRCLEQLRVSEVKVQSCDKFLVSQQLTPSSWVRLEVFEPVPLTSRVSVAQIEVTCNVRALRPEKTNAIAPLLIAAVDIEVQSSDFRSFPNASNEGDACTFIGTTFWVYGEKEPRLRVMQVLGECDPAASIHVESFASERELLVGWRDVMAVRGNPDVVVSYNGTGFDYAYIAARFELTKSRVKYSRFNHLGRLLCRAGKLNKREVTSAGMGQNEVSEFPMIGRVQLDLFQYIKNSQKLSSYKLDDVCKQFLKSEALSSKVVLDYPGWVPELVSVALNALSCSTSPRVRAHCERARAAVVVASDATEDTKEDDDDEDEEKKGRWAEVHKSLTLAVEALDVESGVTAAVVEERVQPALDASGADNYRKLFRMYVAGSRQRGAIASYCQVDCDLVLYLLERLNVLPNMVQMSQVTYTLLSDIFGRGQQIKTFNLIARHSFDGNYVMNFEDVGWDPDAEYEGATVLPPLVGYYERPVVTLDFASLYPSIMQAYNLCFSSIVLDEAFASLPGARYGRYEIAGKTWTFQEHTKGLLPAILEFLVNERRKCKKEMKKFERGSLDYKLADGKQLALKVSCNSVYGFTGVTNHGMFPCMPVAVATTFNGRRLIDETKQFMEERYSATVVYGDTDSVMLQFPHVNTVAEAFAIGGQVAAECSATFREVLSLEFEKVYCPYLLIRKKHYAGMKYEESADNAPVLDAKGLALVRRDNCLMVRTTMKDVLNAVMRDANPMGAYEIVKTQVDKLVEREVELKELEISNFLRTDLQNDHHPHLQVVAKMTRRHAFGIPRVGDRVPYVILEGAKGSQIYERAEHPRFVSEQGLKVDLEYYLRNQLQSRLEKVLLPLPIPSVEALFDEASRESSRRRLGLRRLDKYFGGGGVKRALPPSVVVPRSKKTAVSTSTARKITDFFKK